MRRRRASRGPLRGEQGQAAVLITGLLCVLLVAGLVLGEVARALSVRGERQRGADLAALAGAAAMRGAYDRLFLTPREDGTPDPRRISRADYLALGEEAARRTAERNGLPKVKVQFADEEYAPVQITVGAGARIEVHGVQFAGDVEAVAELRPVTAALDAVTAGAGEYSGPLAHRQGKPMRPDVAMAFDRMAAAAAADGVTLMVTSGFRSNAEQAVLFAAHPDPKWVAPPGRSLHRLGTELDLGPANAYNWLAANAKRFGFLQRYSWEAWHYGYVRSAGTASLGWAKPAKGAKAAEAEGDEEAGSGSDEGDGRSGSALPSYVPARYVPALTRAAQRWSVSAALLAAQIRKESGFDPTARSAAGAQGISQFMPGTAKAYGLTNPLDPEASIDAQAHLRHDRRRQFGDVPLALAAYNAGPNAVKRCGCVPSFPETVAYVATILGWLRGIGDELGATGGFEVRLVR